MNNVYSLDTSALIDGIERFYPILNFPNFWGRIDSLITSGRVMVSEEAWDEALRKVAPLKMWCEEPGYNRAMCVVPTSVAIAQIAGKITNDYPQWSKQGSNNGADPFVIAVAEHHNGIVISGEVNGGPAKPKIPYVCGQRRVPHGRLVDLVRAENWVFP